MRETVVVGVPDLDMVADKWRLDLLPVINSSRFRNLVPATGSGSRGGKAATYLFGNGAALRFMTAGGGDKSRAGFTARVLSITEVDGMDESSETSREANKVVQLEGRTRAYGDRARFYKECTVSIESGHIWTRYQAGTTSRIVLPCPHCEAWVSPEREHFVGWQHAENVVEAAELAHFICPECSEPWTDDDRRAANADCRLLHRGQTIDAEGVIDGEPPKTHTLGFRWSAVNNLFVTAADLGADEYRADQSDDEEQAEKEMRQFVWCLPYLPPAWEVAPLTPKGIMGRVVKDRIKGVVPPDTDVLTVAVDIGKFLAHWIVIAWQGDGTGHIVDYGQFEIPTDSLGVERAILAALREFRDNTCLAGFGAGLRKPDAVWIDAGYMGDVVKTFVREPATNSKIFRPILGRGSNNRTRTRQTYTAPRKRTNAIIKIGEGWHLVWQKAERVHVVEISSDQWKTWSHLRFTTPREEPGAMTLFRAGKNEHLKFSKHLTAERQIEEFVPGKGMVIKWEVLRRANHWLDCYYVACAAANFHGVRLNQEKKPTHTGPMIRRRSTMTTPDGRPFLITER